MWVLLHTAGVLLLALLVLAVSRWGRLGPAARHALWLLVLLKLLAPPFLSWPWPLPVLPSDRRQAPTAPGEETPWMDLLGQGRPDTARQTERPETARDDMALSLVIIDQTADAPTAGERVGFRWDRFLDAAAVVWLCGGLAAAFVQLRRLMHFRRWLRHVGPASPWLASEVKELAVLLGVRPPRLAVLPGLGSPLIWAGGRARLLWPAGLEEELSLEGCRAVLAHELAHLARRDHWVGWLILLAGCVWWWHPLFYLIRRQLGGQEELACDARVVAALPESRRSYAEALLDVCQRQSWTVAATPALGAIGRRRDLERRLVMIMRANVPGRLSLRLLAGIGLLGLIVLPAWTLGQGDTKDSKNAPAERDKQLQELEHKLQALLKEVQALRASKTTAPSPYSSALVPSLDSTVFRSLNTLANVSHFANEVTAPAAPTEVTLSRTTYKMPAEKAEALGKFLQQHVKGVVMEVKVEGENLTITTTPEVQQGIRQFIALTEGKTPPKHSPRYQPK